MPQLQSLLAERLAQAPNNAHNAPVHVDAAATADTVSAGRSVTRRGSAQRRAAVVAASTWTTDTSIDNSASTKRAAAMAVLSSAAPRLSAHVPRARASRQRATAGAAARAGGKSIGNLAAVTGVAVTDPILSLAPMPLSPLTPRLDGILDDTDFHAELLREQQTHAMQLLDAELMQQQWDLMDYQLQAPFAWDTNPSAAPPVSAGVVQPTQVLDTLPGLPILRRVRTAPILVRPSPDEPQLLFDSMHRGVGDVPQGAYLLPSEDANGGHGYGIAAGIPSPALSPVQRTTAGPSLELADDSDKVVHSALTADGGHHASMCSNSSNSSDESDSSNDSADCSNSSPGSDVLHHRSSQARQPRQLAQAVTDATAGLSMAPTAAQPDVHLQQQEQAHMLHGGGMPIAAIPAAAAVAGAAPQLQPALARVSSDTTHLFSGSRGLEGAGGASSLPVPSMLLPAARPSPDQKRVEVCSDAPQCPVTAPPAAGLGAAAVGAAGAIIPGSQGYGAVLRFDSHEANNAAAAAAANMFKPASSPGSTRVSWQSVSPPANAETETENAHLVETKGAQQRPSEALLPRSKRARTDSITVGAGPALRNTRLRASRDAEAATS